MDFVEPGEDAMIPPEEVYGLRPAPELDARVQADALNAQLDTMDEASQKQWLGELLYPVVEELQPELAAKITGMFLEMDVADVVPLLVFREELLSRIDEALEVLATDGLIEMPGPVEEFSKEAQEMAAATGSEPVAATAAAADAANGPNAAPLAEGTIKEGGEEEEDAALQRVLQTKRALGKELQRHVSGLDAAEQWPVVAALLALDNERLQALMGSPSDLKAAIGAAEARLAEARTGASGGVGAAADTYVLIRAGLEVRRSALAAAGR